MDYAREPSPETEFELPVVDAYPSEGGVEPEVEANIEELAWMHQRDPRLPHCLIEAEDAIEHLRHCRRCREAF